MSDIALLNVIRKNPQLRREYEGPSGLEGPSPQSGWQAIVDRHFDNDMIRQGLVLRLNEKVCVKCHTVKSVVGECLCD